jgi:hypothetical protein
MRRGEPGAWAAFDDRFRPILEAFARQHNIPDCEWPVCITELLADEALRLSRLATEVPRRLDAYLMRAVRNRYLRTKRATSCRDRNHLAASEHRWGECIVPTTSSEHALRASAGADALPPGPSLALRRLARELRGGLRDDERAMLDWVSEGIPRRTIAKWLGLEHDACAKRIWRLCQRLRADATARARVYDLSERREIDRFLRRARRAPVECPTQAPSS